MKNNKIHCFTSFPEHLINMYYPHGIRLFLTVYSYTITMNRLFIKEKSVVLFHLYIVLHENIKLLAHFSKTLTLEPKQPPHSIYWCSY